MAKLTTAEFIEAIKELSVLELNDLVKACEEEFGVSAAAGVVVAAAGAGEAAEEKDEFDVELTEVGPKRLRISKLNLRLKALKLLLNNLGVFKRTMLPAEVCRAGHCGDFFV